MLNYKCTEWPLGALWGPCKYIPEWPGGGQLIWFMVAYCYVMLPITSPRLQRVTQWRYVMWPRRDIWESDAFLRIFHFAIFTARKRSLGQGNVFRSVCQLFFRQGSLCMMLLPGWLPGPMFPLGDLCTWSYVPSRGSLSRGLCPGSEVSVRGSLSRGLCPGSEVSVRGVSVQRGVSV